MLSFAPIYGWLKLPLCSSQSHYSAAPADNSIRFDFRMCSPMKSISLPGVSTDLFPVFASAPARAVIVTTSGSSASSYAAPHPTCCASARRRHAFAADDSFPQLPAAAAISASGSANSSSVPSAW